MDELKRLDEVAYVRFASVYREFKDVNSFMAELTSLLVRTSLKIVKLFTIVFIKRVRVQ